MNRFLLFLLFFLLSNSFAFAQKTTKHKVVSGDSFYSIAKKYGVTESDIYELNPKSKGKTLQLNDVLIIPSAKSTAKSTAKTSKKVTNDFHEVVSGESFYTIAKKYDLTIEELQSFNTNTSPSKLQIGTKLALSKNKNTKDSKLGKKED